MYLSKSRQKAENFNLEPLKDLSWWISSTSFCQVLVKDQVKIGTAVTWDSNKIAALATFQKKSEKSHIYQHHFGNQAPNRDCKLYDMIKVIHGYQGMR